MDHHRHPFFFPAGDLAVAAFVVFFLAGPAASQEAAAPAAPAPQAQAWVVNCSTGNATTTLECQMTQNLTEKDSGRRVLTVAIRKQPSDGALTMLLALPHGLYIPAGVSYQVDAGPKNSVPVQTSDQNGAYAAVPVNNELIGSFKSGTNLNIGMESIARKPVTIPVTLSGFTASFDKLNAIK